MRPVEPVMVVDLFPQERQQLLALFADFSAADWEKPTVCPGWTVKDIALHLLGDDIGYLSGRRDRFSSPFFRDKDMQTWDSLVRNINEANEQWVQAMARVSPRLLCELLALTGRDFSAYMQSLDQMAINGVVSWAGPDPAPAWLDMAREYTERWLHQQQIRDAVGKPGLKERAFFHPVLATFVRALPHTYRDVPAASATGIRFIVTGEAGDTWYVFGEARRWSLQKEIDVPPAALVTMDQETCWRLFTRGLSKAEARERTTIEGDQSLGEKVLETVSIIA